MTASIAALLGGLAGGMIVGLVLEIRYRWMVVAFRHEIIAVTAERKFWQCTARQRQ